MASSLIGAKSSILFSQNGRMVAFFVAPFSYIPDRLLPDMAVRSEQLILFRLAVRAMGSHCKIGACGRLFDRKRGIVAETKARNQVFQCPIDRDGRELRH